MNLLKAIGFVPVGVCDVCGGFLKKDEYYEFPECVKCGLIHLYAPEDLKPIRAALARRIAEEDRRFEQDAYENLNF